MTDQYLELARQRFAALSPDDRRAYFDSLSPAQRQEMVDYGEKVEAAHHRLMLIMPRLFSEFTEQMTEAESDQLVYGHLALHHNLLPGEVRLMPLFKVVDILAADLEKKDSQNQERTGDPLTWLDRAKIILSNTPTLSDRKVAKAVGVSHSTLSRCPKYQEFAGLIRNMNSGAVRRGQVRRGGEIEAIDNDGDPASMEWD